MAEQRDNCRPVSVHPDAELLPQMSDDQRAALQDDIKKNGLRVPIIINADGQIIDGLHRYRCCVALGIRPRFERRDIPDKQVTAFVLSMNAQRRHMSTTQRAAVACDVLELRPENFPVTQIDVARYFNVSDRSLRDATAIKRVSPQLHAAMRADTLTLNAARPILRLPESERAEAIHRLLAIRNRAAAKKIAKQTPSRATKVHMPGLIDDWNILLFVLMNVVTLPRELRQVPDRLGEQPLSVKQARDISAALHPFIKMDFADLIAAAHEAIGVLDTIIKDEPIKSRPPTAPSRPLQFL